MQLDFDLLAHFVGKNVIFGFRPEYIYDKAVEKNKRLSESMEIEVEAFLAGNDMLTVSQSLSSAYKAIIKNVRKGKISCKTPSVKSPNPNWKIKRLYGRRKWKR